MAAARVLADGTLQVVGDEMLVEGVGGGELRIASATADHFKDGATILLASGADGLPARMVLGRITGSAQVPDAPLHWRLTAEPWASLAQIQGVYVIAAPARDE